MSSHLIISPQDIQQASARISPYIVRTPLLESTLVNEALGFRLLIKPEILQATGSFKDRGAFNQVLQLTEDQKRRGVFATSAGNHAQGVALATGTFGIAATILMPSDAPKLKVDKTKGYGANVELYDRATQDREATGRQIAETRGLTVIHPFNDVRTIAGQGTIGFEIYEDLAEKDSLPNAIIAPCSGGGMIAGIAEANGFYEKIGDHGATPPQIYTAEPEGIDDAVQSLRTGDLAVAKNKGDELCDALTAPRLGEIPFGILRRRKAIGLVTSHASVKAAMALAQIHFNIRAEGGGGTALACAMDSRENLRGKIVVVVVSGGNIDLEKYLEAVREGYPTLKATLPKLAL